MSYNDENELEEEALDKVEENGAQKVEDKMREVQEMKDAAKTGTSLAKNAASGNYLGAAKDVANLLKNKKIRRRIILQQLIPILIVFLLIFAVAVSLLGVIDSVGDIVQSTIKSEENKDFYEVDYENGGSIEISEEALEKLVESIKSLHLSMDDLKLMGDVDYSDPDIEKQNEEALKKYVKKFYESQAITQALYPNPSFFEKLKGKAYGTVYLQRTKDGDKDLSSVKQMTYMKYEKMKEKADNNDASIMYRFSVDDNGKLVIANKMVITSREGRDSSSETSIDLLHIDYKSAISQYTTPMNFLLYLAIVTQNPEFASAVADLVQNSEIRITVMDKVETYTEHENREYTEHTRTTKKTDETEIVYDSWDVNMEYGYPVPVYKPTYKEKQREESKVTTTITTTPVLAVTYAKTWFMEQTIEYAKTNNESAINNDSYTIEGEDEKEPPLRRKEEKVTWITDDTTTVTVSGSAVEYKETNRGDVKDRTGEKGDPGLNLLGKVDDKTTFLGLLDDKFKIPNSTHKESAVLNLISGSGMFFQQLQKDPDCQNLENIMRYILYKYTGKDYGVTEFDFSVYDAKEFITIRTGMYGSSCEEKVWWALIDAGYSKISAAGAMGNLCVESGFESNRVQGDYLQPNRKQYNADYSQKVNNGIISESEFINNGPGGGGYGLAQWTYPTRKQKLYYYAKQKGVGIDDENMQIEYLLKEMKRADDRPCSNLKQSFMDATTPEEAAKRFNSWMERWN